MFEELDKQLPAELVAVVMCFEGRIYHAYVRDYIEGVYVKMYKQCFGNFTFKAGLRKTKTLHYYAALAQAFKAASTRFVKGRNCVRHQKKYARAIKRYKLHKPFRRTLQTNLATKTRLFGSFFNRIYH